MASDCEEQEARIANLESQLASVIQAVLPAAGKDECDSSSSARPSRERPAGPRGHIEPLDFELNAFLHEGPAGTRGLHSRAGRAGRGDICGNLVRRTSRYRRGWKILNKELTRQHNVLEQWEARDQIL